MGGSVPVPIPRVAFQAALAALFNPRMHTAWILGSVWALGAAGRTRMGSMSPMGSGAVPAESGCSPGHGHFSGWGYPGLSISPSTRTMGIPNL